VYVCKYVYKSTEFCSIVTAFAIFDGVVKSFKKISQTKILLIFCGVISVVRQQNYIKVN